MPVAADPGGQGLRARAAVTGDQVDDLDSLLAFLYDRAAQLRDLAGTVESGPGRRKRCFDCAPGVSRPEIGSGCWPAVSS
jgi:hypothetical protein